MIKKTLLIMALLPLAILLLSCASRRPAESQPPVASPPAKEAAPPPPPPTEEQVYEKYSGDIILEGARPHRVVWGDTLSKLAKRYYGSQNGYYFPLILLASLTTIYDPDVIIGGTVLTIPDLQRNLNDPGTRQMLKDFLYEIADVYASKPKARWSAQTQKRLRALASSL
jgi:hypothetical protein